MAERRQWQRSHNEICIKSYSYPFYIFAHSIWSFSEHIEWRFPIEVFSCHPLSRNQWTFSFLLLKNWFKLDFHKSLCSCDTTHINWELMLNYPSLDKELKAKTVTCHVLRTARFYVPCIVQQFNSCIVKHINNLKAGGLGADVRSYCYRDKRKKSYSPSVKSDGKTSAIWRKYGTKFFFCFVFHCLFSLLPFELLSQKPGYLLESH